MEFLGGGAKGSGVWFFKKKPLAAICVEIFDIVATAPIDAYRSFASQAYGCTPEQVDSAVSKHWAALELGQLKPDEFWNAVGVELTDMGVQHQVPGWKFKGIWDGIISDSLTIDKAMIATIQQVRALKIRTVASSNMALEVSAVLQKHGVFEPFNLAVLSCQINARKPSSEVFKRMAKLARTRPAQCLYIDRNAQNLEAAKAAGYQILLHENVTDTRWQLLQLGLLS